MDRTSDEGEIRPAAGASSAEERCPICLEDYEDKAFIDACFHAFCFECIVKAVEMTTGRCPMCKASFDTVIHNVRAIDDYDRVKVQPKPAPHQSIPQEEAFRTFHGYRTTRLPRQPPRERETTASASSSRSHATAVPPSDPSSAVHLATASSRTHRKKQKSTKFGGQSRKPATLERRRAVYSTGLRAMPIESTDSKRVRVRDISASFFHNYPASTHRLFPWLTREFKVLVGDEHVEFMLQLMQSLIDKIDLENEEFKGHLEPFLYDKSDHFMHELISFAKSPYDMIAYDNKVRYNWPEGHPQAQEQARQRDGINVSDTSSQPGPSGMQLRVLEELMSTRWDTSPPLHSSQPGSHSPTIVIIDSSDSEVDTVTDGVRITSDELRVDSEEPIPTGAGRLETIQTSSTASTSSTLTQENVQARQNEQPIIMTARMCTSALTTSSGSSVVPSDGQERVALVIDGVPRQDQLLPRSESIDRSPEVSSSVALEESDSVHLNDEVSSTSGNNRPASSQPPLESQPSAEILSIEPSSQDQLGEREDDGDFEISLYAEDGSASLGGDGTPTSYVSKGGQARMADDQSKSTRVHKLKKRKESKRRSRERERESRSHHRHSHHHRSRSRSHSRSEKMRSHRHRSPSGSGYYQREGLHHERSSRDRSYRSRSKSRSDSSPGYSDDEVCSKRKKEKMKRTHRKQKEDRRERTYRDEYKLQKREVSRSPHAPHSSHHHERRHHDHHKSRQHHERKHHHGLYSEDSWTRSEHQQSSRTSVKCSTSRVHDVQKTKVEKKKKLLSDSSEERQTESHRTKKLANELNEVEKQIQDNKKELLKSMLRKERLELLQRNLHGESSLASRGVLTANVGSVLEDRHDVSKKTMGEMEKELEVLNRAIVDGKKQLLRVMKKVEEDEAEQDND